MELLDSELGEATLFGTACNPLSEMATRPVTATVGRLCNLTVRQPRTDIPIQTLELRQLGIFRLGLLDNWNVGIGVLPEPEEILIGSLGLGLIS